MRHLFAFYFIVLIAKCFNIQFNTEIKNDNVYITPKDSYFQTLIYLHGVGESPKTLWRDFIGNNTPIPRHTKVIILAAYVNAIDRFNGATLTSWFNFNSFLFYEKDYDTIDLENSARRVYKIIEKEAELLKGNYSNIFIGGFSQGGSLALHVGFNFKHLIGGVISINGLLLPNTISNINIKTKENIPVYIAQGTEDERIPIERAIESYKSIVHLKNVEYHEFNMDHSVSIVVFREIKIFIEKLTKENRLYYFNIFY